MKPRNLHAKALSSPQLRGRVKPMIRDRAPSLQEGYDQLEGHLLSPKRFPVGKDLDNWIVERGDDGEA